MVACVAFEYWELEALRETFEKDRWVDKRDRALLDAIDRRLVGQEGGDHADV